MADIAVYHPHLDTRGGGEVNCMRTLEALQHDHDLTVYSLNDPDFDALNSQFNTSVTRVKHQSLGIRNWMLSGGAKLVRGITGQSTRRLQAALSYSYIDNQSHDLIVSTYNEYGFKTPSVQYIDFPNFGPRFQSRPETTLQRVYGTICNIAHRGDREQIRNSALLTNSEWSANIVEAVYETRPRVVYPPIDTSAFDPRPWDEREDGFVSIGRADHIKRPLVVMSVFEELTRRGHDVHLHWLGAVGDDAYGRKVRRRAAAIERVTLEGKVPFERVAKMASTHKYGLHGCPDEHFGIAVAELLAGGALPFVPNGGGQREIVGRSERVVYRDAEDAVSKIESVLEDSNGREIRESLPDVEATFGLERFRREMRTAVSEALDDAR